MTEPLDSDIQDRRLWQQSFAEENLKLSDLPGLDPNLLAAYLQGSAKPEEIELLEASLASNPLLLEEFMALRQISAMDSTPAPASLLRRAKALNHRYSWRPRFQWAAAAAAVLLACMAGYSVGGATLRGQNQAQSLVSSRASLEVDELIAEPTFGIILPLNGNNGR